MPTVDMEGHPSGDAADEMQGDTRMIKTAKKDPQVISEDWHLLKETIQGVTSKKYSMCRAITA